MANIDYKNAENCINLRYKDTVDMSVDDAIFILSKWVERFHEASSSGSDMTWLPRPILIRAYEIAIACMRMSKMK